MGDFADILPICCDIGRIIGLVIIKTVVTYLLYSLLILHFTKTHTSSIKGSFV
jgi:hypothetical protein